MLKLTQQEVQIIIDSLQEPGVSLERCTAEQADALIDKLDEFVGTEQTWLTRLEQEFDELDERIQKLYSFFSTDKFKELNPFDRELLNMQYNNMSAYAITLNIRINRAKQNV